MTNEQIILSNRVFLMEEGLIKGTGEMFEFEGRKIEVPEEIHTFNVWKSLGYTVKKGEHSIARFPIWEKMAKKKKKDEDDEEKQEDGRYYKRVAHFFVRDQVEKI